MKQDVIDALSGKFPRKIPSKETLNHPGIINHVAGFDVFENTPRAFDLGWEKLGIDIHTPLPQENAARPKVPGGTWEEDGWQYSDYGVFPTRMPIEYQPDACGDVVEQAFQYDVSSDDFDLADRIASLREMNNAFRAHFRERAVMYDLYYTTLFMWPVETFGWEPFLMAAATDPERFERVLWEPWARVSRKQFEALAAIDEEVIFCHDDIAMTSGPVFRPDFYEKYIFSRYEWIMQPVLDAGKKVVFVSDGNIEVFLDRLLQLPISGIMFENPATPFERVLETWGAAQRGFIGGISTSILTLGTPEEVRTHTREVIEKGSRYPGFIISSCGQLPGNIPMDNILAYFQMRDEMGIPAQV